MKDRENTGGVVLTSDVGETDSDGRTILQVECGLNNAVLYLAKLCQGSKGACVLFDDAWMTPNEFQAASGRELAKDWKRSIKHHDKSLKLLIIKGFLFLDPAVCRCEHCVSSSSSPSADSHMITTSPSETKIPKETKKRPARTELTKQAKKRKVNKVRTAKSTNVGTTNSARPKKSARTKSANVDTDKSANVATINSANVGTNNSANVGNSKSANSGTNNSANVGNSKSANSGTNSSANVGNSKSANSGTIKSANVETTKSAKTRKTTKRGKRHKSPLRQRKTETVRKGKRGVSQRNVKNTTKKTNTKRASRSLGKGRVMKGVNGISVIAPEEVNGEQRKHVEYDTDLSEDNSEDIVPLADTKSSPKQHTGTVEENGEETDLDSTESIRSDGQLTHEKTLPCACNDSETQDVDHDSSMHTPKSTGIWPHELYDDTGSATAAANESSSESERSCTPLSNYIANESGKGCKITIKKTSNGFITGDECGVISRQQGQSGNCFRKVKSRKSFVSESVPKRVIACGVVSDYKTDGPTVDHNDVSRIKSDTDTDAVSDNTVGGPSESTISGIVSVYKTDETVIDGASCCKSDTFTEICDVASRCKTDSDTDVHYDNSRCKVDAVNDAKSDCESGGSGELIIAELEHNEEREPETDALAPEKIDICADVSVIFTEEASMNAHGLIFSRHSKDMDSVSLPAEENDQSFAKPGCENQGIDAADKSSSGLLGPCDDDTEVLNNNNVMPPAAPGEPISPKREARLLNIIQELKTYKKQLSAKIDETKRHVDFNVSPLHDILQNDNTSIRAQPQCVEPERRSSPDVRDANSESPSSNDQTPTFVRQLQATSLARDLMNAAPRRTKTRRKESAIVRQLTGPTVGQARTQAWVNENGTNIYYTAQSNDGGSLATIPLSSYGAESRVTVSNQVVHSDSIRNSRYSDIVGDPLFSSDKCMLKVPKRYSDNVSFPLRNGCDYVPSALSASANKRKSATPRTNPVSKKQRCSWPLNKTDAASCLLDLTKCIASNAAPKTKLNASYGSAPSQSVGRVTEKSPSDVQVPSLTRSVRRSQISSWTADDVYSFVLSSPHAAIYAKDFLELRITGRVLQNLTAIQMMRILRIGEHAARAVRTAVEKVLLTSSATRNQSIRR